MARGICIRPGKASECAFCGLPFISFDGTIVCSEVCGFWRSVDVAGEYRCWQWHGSYSGVNKYGWRRPLFCYRGAHICAVRYIWFICHGPAYDLEVCHSCDNPECVNPAHLFFGTHQDNMHDMVAKGRQAKGERNGLHKLTEADVGAIRANRNGLTQPQRASLYGVTQSVISRVENFKRWRHIRPD